MIEEERKKEKCSKKERKEAVKDKEIQGESRFK